MKKPTLEDIANLSDEQREILELAAFGELARLRFDLEAYELFHWCIYQHWIKDREKKVFAAHFGAWEKNKEIIRGILNKAARGMYKSTDEIGFVLFVMGHFPHLSNLVIQDIESNAKRVHTFMMETIDSNRGWKACFPNVVPDKERGWSLDGCYIKKTHDMELVDGKWKTTPVPYDQWIQKTTQDHKRDPSFLCVPVKSGAIGMHPTGCLLIDDIHTSKNTNSAAEMAAIVNTVKADILPTMTARRKPVFLVAYTPWKPDDSYALFENSGLFEQLYTPAFFYDENGSHEFQGKKITLVDPSVYSLGYLEQQHKILGKREFNRQILCTLDITGLETLPYYSYTMEGNEWQWPVIAGADPNGVDKDRMTGDKELSNFGIAYVGRNPQGGAVVLDGWLEQSTYSEADMELLSAQSRYPSYQIAVLENVGSGSAYYAHVRNNSNLRITTGDIMSFDKQIKRVKSKDDRIREMAVWFENGVVKVANKDTKFLSALRYLFNHFYELDKNQAHMAWDAGDAVYQALKGMPDVLQIQQFTQEIRLPGEKVKLGLGSVWNALGS